MSGKKVFDLKFAFLFNVTFYPLINLRLNCEILNWLGKIQFCLTKTLSRILNIKKAKCHLPKPLGDGGIYGYRFYIHICINGKRINVYIHFENMGHTFVDIGLKESLYSYKLHLFPIFFSFCFPYLVHLANEIVFCPIRQSYCCIFCRFLWLIRCIRTFNTNRQLNISLINRFSY